MKVSAVMDVVLQYFPDCPNWRIAAERLGEAVRSVGWDGHSVRYQVVSSPEEAEEVGFAGSPTILIDGRDPFGDEVAVGFSCRVYRTESGADAAPSVDQLRAVLAP